MYTLNNLSGFSNYRHPYIKKIYQDRITNTGYNPTFTVDIGKHEPGKMIYVCAGISDSGTTSSPTFDILVNGNVTSFAGLDSASSGSNRVALLNTYFYTSDSLQGSITIQPKMYSISSSDGDTDRTELLVFETFGYDPAPYLNIATFTSESNRGSSIAMNYKSPFGGRETPYNLSVICAGAYQPNTVGTIYASNHPESKLIQFPGSLPNFVWAIETNTKTNRASTTYTTTGGNAVDMVAFHAAAIDTVQQLD